MGILIDTVRVSNFRSLKNIEVKLGPVTLLTGINNSGKTSFLKALQLALGVERRYVGKEDFFIGKDGNQAVGEEILIDIRIVHVDDKGDRKDRFEIEWMEEFGEEFIKIDQKGKQYAAIRTRISLDELKGDYSIDRFAMREWNENFEEWQGGDKTGKRFPAVGSIPLYFIDAQRDIIEDLRIKSSYMGRLISNVKFEPEQLKEIEDQLDELNTNVISGSPVLSHLREKLEELNQTISTNRQGVEITPFTKKVRDFNKGLNIHFQDNESESFPIEHHGMGTRSWASLLTFNAYISWLAGKAGTDEIPPLHPILALEEPEAHLHPNGQRHIYSQLKQMTGQKIISTHSPIIGACAEISEIRNFSKEGEQTVIKRIDASNFSPEDVRKIKREVMNTRGEILFSKALVLFEGETEEQALQVFARKYWGKSPFELGVNYVGVSGKNNYDRFLRVAEGLGIKWFILSDGEVDTVKSLKRQLKSITGKEIDIKTLKNISILDGGNDFEGYLIENDYSEELYEAVKAVEGEDFFDHFLNTRNGTTERKQKKTGKVCSECGREIKEKIIRDFLSDGGRIKALKLCLKEGKTKYASKIAEIISNLKDEKRRFPSAIKRLFDAIAVEIGVPQKKNKVNDA